MNIEKIEEIAEEIVCSIESFDSFFAGLAPRDEKRAIKLYEKAIAKDLRTKIVETLSKCEEEAMEEELWEEYNKAPCNLFNNSIIK